MSSDSMREALEATGAMVQADAPLKKRAYWRVGGCADFLVEVSTTAQLSAVLALGPAVVLGNGSNALIHDEGIRGVVLKLVGDLADLEVDGTSAWAGGGLLLTVLLSRLDKRGLAGAEPFAGVPGTVGGAVVMNAGTRLGEAAELVESAELVLPGGEMVTFQAADLAFSYRHARIPSGAVVARARLRLVDSDVEARLAQRQEFLKLRKATQPLDLPSCGSTFTNPPEDHAARLIQAAGLKGLRHGGASISTVHANFIVNHGEATAEDIRWLIATARCTVRDRFDVWLTPEVRLLGDWPEGALDKA